MGNGYFGGIYFGQYWWPLGGSTIILIEIDGAYEPVILLDGAYESVVGIDGAYEPTVTIDGAVE